MRVAALVLGVLGPLLFVGGCTTYRDQLGRGERAFEQNDADRTLAILRDLEPDFQRLTTAEQADYAYIRGMTDYNVGYKNDARHWLAVANGYEAVTPNVLTPERKTKVAAALTELNAIVYKDNSTVNLVNARKEEPAAAKAPADKADHEESAPAPAAKKPAKKPKADEPPPDE